jgi:hypothetical protein
VRLEGTFNQFQQFITNNGAPSQFVYAEDNAAVVTTCGGVYGNAAFLFDFKDKPSTSNFLVFITSVFATATPVEKIQHGHSDSG